MNRTLPDRIFICGFMGAGKSTAGKALADKVEMPFHDLDNYIEQITGQSIPVLFETEGEQGFRSAEQAALLDITRKKKGIIALGGGTLQNQHLVDHIKVNGMLVFIDTSIEKILERIMCDTQRPLLLDGKGQMKSKPVLKEDLASLLETRRPYYEQAEVTIDTGQYLAVEDLATELLKKIRYHVALH